jgi:hypothetical protein
MKKLSSLKNNAKYGWHVYVMVDSTWNGVDLTDSTLTRVILDGATSEASALELVASLETFLASA